MTVRFGPELDLTIACCRWPRSPERDEAIRAAAARVTDWALFERIVARHRVMPLVRDGLSCGGIELPAALERRFGERAAECAIVGLAMARESVRLQRAFGDAGLPALVIKGIPLAILAYGDVGLKQSWDIDLLTSPDALPEARALLQALGYEMTEPTRLTPAQFDRFVQHAMEAVYVHHALGLTVELHWRVALNKLLLPGVDANSPSQAVRAAGAELRTFDDEILFAYVCVHGAQHAWARLKWLADLAALLAVRGPAEVERLYRRAVDLGAGRTPAVALLLCWRLFGVPLSPPLLAELRRDRFVRLIEAIALGSINDPGEMSEALVSPPVGLRWCSLFLVPGPAYVRAQARVIWNIPFERARFGGPPFALAFHLLRIPLWLGRLAKRARHRFARQGARAVVD